MNAVNKLFYLQSYLRLANFLDEEIEDFDRLIEEARIDNKTLQLARKVESRFGKGSYRRLVTASEEEAEQVLAELKERKSE